MTDDPGGGAGGDRVKGVRAEGNRHSPKSGLSRSKDREKDKDRDCRMDHDRGRGTDRDRGRDGRQEGHNGNHHERKENRDRPYDHDHHRGHDSERRRERESDHHRRHRSRLRSHSRGRDHRSRFCSRSKRGSDRERDGQRRHLSRSRSRSRGRDRRSRSRSHSKWRRDCKRDGHRRPRSRSWSHSRGRDRRPRSRSLSNSRQVSRFDAPPLLVMASSFRAVLNPNSAAEGTPEGKKPNLKKRKENKERSPAVVSYAGAVAMDDVSAVDRKDACEDGSIEKMDGGIEPVLFQEEVKNVQNIYSPRGSPIRSQRKKLLILDLNGLLADINQDHHNSQLSHAKVRGQLVFKRPYYDDFLRFCFDHFHLGIWSSRLRANVDSVVDILMKDLKQRLLFCWDLSKCTPTGLNTLENKRKPIVLKELKKLWNNQEPGLPWKEGEFSPSNTLLVDDSPYKALCNPPHTAVFPYSYSYKNEKDDSLGLGGDLRLFLENLSTADDVQRYVKEHPFGQRPITQSDPNWQFYVQILEARTKESLA